MFQGDEQVFVHICWSNPAQFSFKYMIYKLLL